MENKHQNEMDDFLEFVFSAVAIFLIITVFVAIFKFIFWAWS